MWNLTYDTKETSYKTELEQKTESGKEYTYV